MTKRKLFLGLGLMLLVLAGGIYLGFSGSLGRFVAGIQDKGKVGGKPPSVKETTQWVNCNDARDVIEEENRLYIACLGGVLVVDASSGEVVDQISMANGLGNNVTNSLVKKGEVLYVGTQDGFTIFNLKSRQAKKISVKEGLISGSNVKLAEDGKYLWVGTFEGLSRYNTETGEIKNFTSELADNSSQVNASHILVTPKAIYVIVEARGVARLDKESQTWERFGPPSFLDKIDQYSRVDFFELASVGNRVLVASDKMIWESENEPSSTWKKLENVVAAIKGEERVIVPHLVSGEAEAGIVVNGFLYKYNPNTGEVKVVYPNFTEGDNILGQSGLIRNAGARGKKIWVTPYIQNSGSDKDIWLGWVAATGDLQTGYLKLAGRPKEFGRVMAVVDGKPILTATGGLLEYDPLLRKFRQMSEMGLSDPASGGSPAVFQPVPGTASIFLFSQFCGMGCEEPKFAIFDYKEGSIKFLKMPDEISKDIKFTQGRAPNYNELTYEGYFSTKREFSFTTGIGEDRKKFILQDTGDWTWRLEKRPEAGSDGTLQPRVSFCNPNYIFGSNGDKFKELACTKEVENSSYKWTYEKSGDTYELFQENKSSGEKIKMEMPSAPNPYSPFKEWKFTQTVSGMTYAQGKLWVGTNKGLAVYDPQNSKWTLISTKEGLISNEVTSFAVSGTVVWVTTNWGGLSAVILQ